MKKLMHYIKPYIGYAIAVVVLLFCQSAVDLNLPNLMSDIVNVGIQQGGITETAPKAIAPDSFEMMLRFMSEEDRQAVEDSYSPDRSDRMSDHDWKNLQKTFPEAESQEALYFQPQSEEDASAAEDAFGRSAYAFMNFMQGMAGDAKAPEASEAPQADSSEDVQSHLSELTQMAAFFPPGAGRRRRQGRRRGPRVHAGAHRSRVCQGVLPPAGCRPRHPADPLHRHRGC